MRTQLVLLLALFVAACGGATGSGDAGGTDLLIGSWFEQVTPVTSDDQTVTITFRADHTYTLVHTQLHPSTSAQPGCTETQTDVGTYVESGSGSAMRLGWTADAAMSGTTVLSGCTNASDDGPGVAGTPFVTAPALYTVTASTLSILSDAGMVVSSFMRQ